MICLVEQFVNWYIHNKINKTISIISNDFYKFYVTQPEKICIFFQIIFAMSSSLCSTTRSQFMNIFNSKPMYFSLTSILVFILYGLLNSCNSDKIFNILTPLYVFIGNLAKTKICIEAAYVYTTNINYNQLLQQAVC